MPQRKARSGRQKSIGKTRAARKARTVEIAEAAPDLSALELQPDAGQGVEYPVPRLAWSLRPS